MDEDLPPSGADSGPLPDGMDATRVLRMAARGEPAGQEMLFELLQGELRVLAGRAMSDEQVGHTLQPTALVGEVWLKLFAGDADEFQDRRHFLAVAARAMRQILVDHARARNRVKRGGAWRRIAVEDIDGLPLMPTDGGVDIVELDGVLDELRELSPRQADVVELRFFAGLEVDDVADALGSSPRTIAREWRFARAWLLQRMKSA